MYLKIMSGENAPDGDSRKTFRILDEVVAVNFDRIIAPKDEKKPEHTASRQSWPEGRSDLQGSSRFAADHRDVLAGRQLLSHERGRRYHRVVRGCALPRMITIRNRWVLVHIFGWGVCGGFHRKTPSYVSARWPVWWRWAKRWWMLSV